MALKLSRNCPFTLYVSNTLQSVSLLTLSKAFSWSTKTRFSSRLYSIAFSLCFRKTKMASVHPLTFLKPISASLSSGPILYLLCCSRILAEIFSDWYKYCPLLVFRDFSLFQGLLEYCGKPCGPGSSTC